MTPIKTFLIWRRRGLPKESMIKMDTNYNTSGEDNKNINYEPMIYKIYLHIIQSIKLFTSKGVRCRMGLWFRFIRIRENKSIYTMILSILSTKVFRLITWLATQIVIYIWCNQDISTRNITENWTFNWTTNFYMQWIQLICLQIFLHND